MTIPDNTVLICKCGGTIKIEQQTDWHTLRTYFYPKCECCGFTTKDVFDSRKEVVEYIRIIFNK